MKTPLMTLRQLTQSNPDITLHGDTSIEVSGIAYDSRKVEPGNLFVCIKGFRVDGHTFIPEAIARGAGSLLVQDPEILPHLPKDFPVGVCPSTRTAIADVACEFYGHPTRKICLVGVTGTNGKTTTAHLVASILDRAGFKAGVLGTIGAFVLGETESLTMERTTPEATDLQRLLAEFVERGVTAVAMEVSSHSLVLERVRGCAFDVGVFTNLTQDHLDFHTSLEEYTQAKARLFTDYALASSNHKRFGAIINLDDPAGKRFVQLCPFPSLTYGIATEAHMRAMSVDIRPSGASFTALRPNRKTPIALHLTGRFNVYNALAAFGVGEMLEIDPEVSRAGLEAVDHLPGRLQMVHEGQDFSVCVDYAHTPDGLDNILRTAREMTEGRLITVFGCGGDRDPGKRPKMGAVAAALSDLVVVTSDNPRTEDPLKIVDAILEGIPKECACHVEPDRRKAIEFAILMAQKGDFVLLAGKGHETYQIFRDQTIHFDDREVARDVLRHRATQGG